MITLGTGIPSRDDHLASDEPFGLEETRLIG